MAIKFLERGPGVNKSVLREILNHRLCVVHPNIVQFREIFLTPVHLAIVMEFAAGGDMFEYVIKHKLPQHGQASGTSTARAPSEGVIHGLNNLAVTSLLYRSMLARLAGHALSVPCVRVCMTMSVRWQWQHTVCAMLCGSKSHMQLSTGCEVLWLC